MTSEPLTLRPQWTLPGGENPGRKTPRGGEPSKATSRGQRVEECDSLVCVTGTAGVDDQDEAVPEGRGSITTLRRGHILLK